MWNSWGVIDVIEASPESIRPRCSSNIWGIQGYSTPLTESYEPLLGNLLPLIIIIIIITTPRCLLEEPKCKWVFGIESPLKKAPKKMGIRTAPVKAMVHITILGKLLLIPKPELRILRALWRGFSFNETIFPGVTNRRVVSPPFQPWASQRHSETLGERKSWSRSDLNGRLIGIIPILYIYIRWI